MNDIERQLQQRHRQEQKRGEHEGLHKALAGESFSPVAKFWRDLALQEEPKNPRAIEKSKYPQGEADPAAVLSLAVEFRRQRVGGDFLGRSLRDRFLWKRWQGYLCRSHL